MPRGGVHAALLNKLTFSPVEFLPGQASIALDVGGKVPTGPLTVSVSPGQGMAPNVTVTLEVSSPGGQGEGRRGPTRTWTCWLKRIEGNNVRSKYAFYVWCVIFV